MFGLAQHQAGPDYDATCSMLRRKGKSALEPLQRVFLSKFITGRIHTQERMQKAGFSADS